MAKKRIEHIDIAKGIAILFVIIGHTIPDGIVKNIIYSFHMPVFFFLSGFFFKPRPIKKLLARNAKRLLLPYAVTAGAITVLCTLKKLVKLDLAGGVAVFKQYVLASLYCSGVDMPLYQGASLTIPDIGGIWFLPALFIAFVILNPVVRYRHGFVIVAVLACLGAFTKELIWLPFSIQSAMVCTVYMYCGWAFRNYDIFQKFDRPIIWCAAVICWISGAIIAGANIAASVTFETGVLNFVVAFLGILVIHKLSMIVDAHGGVAKKMLLFWGRETLFILCIHITETKVLPWWEVRHKIVDTRPFLDLTVILGFICLKMLIAYLGVMVKRHSKILNRIF